MKRLPIILLAGITALGVSAQKFRHVETTIEEPVVETPTQQPQLPEIAPKAEAEAEPDTVALPVFQLIPIEIEERQGLNDGTLFLLPRVFNGYRYVAPKRPQPIVLTYDALPIDGNIIELPDSVRTDEPQIEIEVDEDGEIFPLPDPAFDPVDLDKFNSLPTWLVNALTNRRIVEDVVYSSMVKNPEQIDFAYWDLPVPPRLPDEDYSFASYLRKHQPIDIPKEFDVETSGLGKRHWLHSFNAALQFSQAYLSPNWYQGGNNYLALLANLYWNVELNPVYHPNLLFQSTLSYKLGLNSVKDDQYHKYSISEDLFQYNAKAGFRAFKSKWFYTMTLQFKTQILNNYPSNSLDRKASLLSPGDLNVALGMTYSLNKPRTKLNVSIGPLSYNLRTCIDDLIDPTQFNIPLGKHTQSEIGSNAEVTLVWDICSNINLKSRLFLFTNYKYFTGDLENTISFAINRFLSTQIYLHMRYDTSAPSSNTSWKKFQLKEILSFGLSYTFNTKP